MTKAETITEKYFNLVYNHYNQEKWFVNRKDHGEGALDALCNIQDFISDNLEKDIEEALEQMRNETLEEAANVCEKVSSDFYLVKILCNDKQEAYGYGLLSVGARDCAQAMRNLGRDE